MNLDLIAMITMLIIMSLFGIGILLCLIIWNWNIIMFDYYMVGSMYYT